MPAWVQVAVAVGAVVALSTAGFVAANPPLNPPDWDVIFRYKIDDANDNVTEFNVTGTYDEAFRCNGSWTEIVNTTLATTDDRHFIDYGINPLDGELGFAEQENLTIDKHTWVCDDPATIPTDHDGYDANGFIRAEACYGGGDESDNGLNLYVTPVSYNPPRGFAPFSSGKEEVDSQDVDQFDCIVAGGAGYANQHEWIPYTGRVEAELWKNAASVANKVEMDVIGGYAITGIPKPKVPDCLPGDPCEVKAKVNTLFDIHGLIGIGHYRAWQEEG